MKKTNGIIILSILVTTYFFLGVSSINAETSVIVVNDSDLVKSINGSAIYLISGTTKKVFPHISVYQSWGYPEDFSTIKTIPDDKLENYTEGEPVYFRDGSLFRGTATSLYGKESSAVFVVSDGQLRAIRSSEVYQGLYNDPSWARVTWVPDDLLSKFEYPLGNIVESSDMPLNGSIVKYANSNTNYLIKDGKKKIIETTAFNLNRLLEKNIIQINIRIEDSNISTDVEEITTADDYLTSPIYSSNFKGNKKPIIENILWKQLDAPQNNWGAYQLTVNAYDPDENTPLIYDWNIDCGYFFGDTNEQNVIWHYSNIIGCQDAWVTITITDSKGLSVTKTQNVFSLSILSEVDPPAEEEDNISPIISNIQTSNITYNSSTITWNTDEQTTSQVEYGITTNYGNSTTYNSIFKTSHNHYLSGLSDETPYHYRVVSIDVAGNQTTSNDYTFTTEEIVSNVDITPPTISNVSTGTTTSYSATITWLTNEASDSQIEYGLTANYGNSTNLNNSLVTNHNQILNGLSDYTLYHYRVKSKDSAGNQSISDDYTFTTEEIVSNVDTTPPTISDIYVNDFSSTHFSIAWVTDEFSSSIIQCGLSIDYEIQNISDYEILALNHSNTCSGIEPNTLYHYRIGSTDEAGNTRWSDDMTFTTPSLGTISIKKDYSYDSEIILAGTINNDAPIAKIKFTTTNENFLVNKLTVSIANNIYDRSVDGIRLFYDNITTGPQFLDNNGDVIFTDLNWTISKDTSQILTIYADPKSIEDGAQSGDEINIGLNCSTAGNCEILSGQIWGDNDNELPDVAGNTMYLRKSKPYIREIFKNVQFNGTNSLNEITVTASSFGDITLKKLSWEIFIEDDIIIGEGLSVTNWKIYNGAIPISSVWSDGINISTTGDLPIVDTNSSNNTILSVEFDNEIEIPAGSDKTFVLKGSISGFFGGGNDNVLALLSNNDRDVIKGGLINHDTELVKIDEGNVESSSNFIWSDKSCGVDHTDEYQDVYKDWFSGYLVECLR